MTDGQRGRPKKHIHENHHYKSAEQVTEAQDDIQEVTEEDPIVENVNPNSPSLILTDSIFSTVSDASVNILESNPAEELSVSDPKSGWKSIETAPHNGLPTVVSENGYNDGVVAFWKRSRAFVAKRWKESGYWCDNGTGLKVDFIPQYWKERF